jgi:hypothetical protein
MAVHKWTRQEKFKRGVWAVAFAACIFAGTITGAQLKTDNEKKEAGHYLQSSSQTSN